MGTENAISSQQSNDDSKIVITWPTEEGRSVEEGKDCTPRDATH